MISRIALRDGPIDGRGSRRPMLNSRNSSGIVVLGGNENDLSLCLEKSQHMRITNVSDGIQ